MPALQFFATKDIEWDDLQVYIEGVPCGKVTHFECGVKTEKGYIYGQGSKPLSIQSGNKQYPFQLTLYKAAADSMWLAAVAAGGDDVTDVKFDIQGSFKAYGQRALSTLSVSGCEITDFMYKISQNDKSMSVELPGLAMGITIL